MTVGCSPLQVSVVFLFLLDLRPDLASSDLAVLLLDPFDLHWVGRSQRTQLAQNKATAVERKPAEDRREFDQKKGPSFLTTSDGLHPNNDGLQPTF